MLKTIKPKSQDTITIAFKSKRKSGHLSTQDKNHIRYIAIHNLIAKDRDIFCFLLAHEFIEKFRFDKKKQTAYYIIKLKKGVLPNAESQSDDKSN
ncbi:MAG: hypothetical protein J6S85_21880 [Methanobrevibacter sp.]|nr:hypothetical protein [Methanobrevibacter sp.]